MKTNWENSIERYTQLLSGLDELIENSFNLLMDYEQNNMSFAHMIYKKGLTDTMDKNGHLRDYEKEFMVMYYSLKGQVDYLKHLRDSIRIMIIKDPVNCPEN